MNLDFYDDENGTILKSKIASLEKIPEFIKSAEKLDKESLNKLPDDVFALVARNGNTTFRKYACVDRGNTALSVLYFMENRDRLPLEAQKTAAANLLTACSWYDIQPPLELQKLAFVGKMIGAATLLGGIPEASKKFKMQKQMLNAGVPGREVMKASEVSGTDAMPYSREVSKKAGARWKAFKEGFDIAREARGAIKGLGKTTKEFGQESLKGEPLAALGHRIGYLAPKAAKAVAGTAALGTAYKVGKKKGESSKTASMNPHIDITGLEPAPKFVKESGSIYCLTRNGKPSYPINTKEQVKKANAYFMEYKDDFTPFERHQYCVKLASRAKSLDVPVDKLVEKYGSKSYATDAGIAIYSRQRLFREGTSERSLLEEMRDKYASVNPEVMATALEKFDRENNLDLMWGRDIEDPYLSLFGMTKEAEYSFVDRNRIVSASRLQRCAKEQRDGLIDLFGEDFANEFAEDPVGIFESMPLDKKRIIMNLAASVEQ